MKVVLLGAAAYNIGGALLILFLLERVAPLVGFAPLGNALFRLFVGGTALTFGIAYADLSRRPGGDLRLLYYGTALKYWAFLVSLYCFLFEGLSSQVLLLFGCGNLLFAVLFTWILAHRRRA